MKRYVVATAVLAMMITLGSVGTAQAAGKTHIKLGGVWTISSPTNAFNCDVHTFGAGHTFTVDRFGDAGTYTGGKKKLVETYTAGGDAGSTFKGTWSKTHHDYQGTWVSSIGTPYAAILTPGTSCP
jgi:hypothetical protein